MIRVPDVFFFQAEDGIRDLVRSRGLGDVYKRQGAGGIGCPAIQYLAAAGVGTISAVDDDDISLSNFCLLYTSDAADERSSVDLGGRRLIKKKKQINVRRSRTTNSKTTTTITKMET